MVADKVVAKEAASIPVTVPWSSSFGFTASLWRIFLLCTYRQVSTCFRACTKMTCDCAVLPGRNDFCFQTYFDISKVGEKCKYISTHRHCTNAQNCYARWYWPRARNRWEKSRAALLQRSQHLRRAFGGGSDEKKADWCVSRLAMKQ